MSIFSKFFASLQVFPPVANSENRAKVAPPRRYVSKLVPHNSNVLTLLILLVSSIQAITQGYDGSMMNGLNILPSYTDYFNLTTATLALNTASVWMGATFIGIFAGQITDWLGRKWTMFYSAVLCIIGVIIQTAAQNAAMFICGRVIIGVSTGLSGVAAAVYLAETAPVQWRAFMLGALFDMWYVGGLISAGITYGTQNILNTWAWRLPSLFQLLASAMCIAILPFVPESPRWLAYQDRADDCLEVLAVSHGWGDKNDPVVLTEYKEIVETLAFEKIAGSVSVKETMRTPGNRYRLLLVFSVAIFSMTAGNNIVTYYLGTMLDEAGVTNTNTQLQVNIIMSAWSFLCSLVGTAFCERLGRKWLVGVSQALCAIFLFLVGAFDKLYGDGTNQSGSYATVAMMFLFMGSYSWGWTPLTVMYPAEVLNYSTRATGMGIYVFWANGMGLMITFAFPFALAAIGWQTYMINGAFNVFVLAFVLYFWYETKGRTLEEMDVLFDGEKHADVPDVYDVMKGGKMIDDVAISVREVGRV